MKLLFVGDVMLGRLVNEALKYTASSYPWGDTLDIFQDADYRICNLECGISDLGTPWSATPKVFHFRSDAKNVEVLKLAAINAVSLANNHTLDYGYEAMLDMLTTLEKAGISYAGAGKDFKRASAVALPELGQGSRSTPPPEISLLGMIAFTDNEPGWAASEDKPGVFHVPVSLEDRRAKQLFQMVKEAKTNVDLLILSAHWGPNWGYRPQPNHVRFAKALIDAGADIVFGHSCHVFQGIEIYKGRPILYSTGNFVDDYAVDETERNDQSFIFIVETDRNEIVRLRLYPTVIRNMQARKATGAELRAITSKMIELCSEFGTQAIWQSDEKSLLIDLGK